MRWRCASSSPRVSWLYQANRVESLRKSLQKYDFHCTVFMISFVIAILPVF